MSIFYVVNWNTVNRAVYDIGTSSSTATTASTTAINNEENGTKKSTVTFKMPSSDDYLGKSVGDITAGKKNGYATQYLESWYIILKLSQCSV